MTRPTRLSEDKLTKALQENFRLKAEAVDYRDELEALLAENQRLKRVADAATDLNNNYELCWQNPHNAPTVSKRFINALREALATLDNPDGGDGHD